MLPSFSRRSAVAALCLSPLPLLAQNTVTQLEQVVVTPGRSAQSLAQAMGDLTVITREELQRAGADSVAGILSRQPGVQFTDTGGPQSPTGIMLRGANANQTLVLIDGVRINGSIQSGAHWGALDPAVIERIEILRGAASSLYGSDAIGGVVNIITRKADTDRPLTGWADLGIGSHNTFRSATGVSGAANGWDYALSAGLTESDGYGSTHPTVSFDGHHPDNDGYTQRTVSGSLGRRWAEGQHLGLNFYNSYLNGDYDAGEWIHPAYSVTRQQAYSLTSTNDITDRWQSVLRAGLSKESYDDRAWGTTFSSLQRSYNWQHNLQLHADHKLSAYIERLEERPVHSDGLGEARRDTNAVGAVYSGRHGRHAVQASLRNDNVSGYGNEVTGGLGYDFALDDAWTIGVAGNTGFHAPTFADLYYPGSENPNLRPEKSRNIEAHLGYSAGKLNLGATVYQNKIRDLIYWDNAAFRMENTGRATIRGVTLTGEYEWGNTTLRANADFMQPRDDTTGERLLRRSRQQYMLAAEHRFETFRLGAEYHFVGNREDTAVDPVSYASYRSTLGGYSLVNLTAAFDLTANASVQVRWNNVLNKDYANAYGYQTPGSNVFVNLSLRM